MRLESCWKGGQSGEVLSRKHRRFIDLYILVNANIRTYTIVNTCFCLDT